MQLTTPQRPPSWKPKKPQAALNLLGRSLPPVRRSHGTRGGPCPLPCQSHGTLQPLSKEEPSPPAGGGCPNLSAATSIAARGIDPLSVTYGDAVCAPDLGRAASAAERRLALTTA
jgi:hypothetical protein